LPCERRLSAGREPRIGDIRRKRIVSDHTREG
jgi:hypothetical protein